ncbi:keratin-associated protein 5-5 [Lingula anatina]|uniref:Keratin-associated protein 5-5 n=1 Tax=Lingula anatina TaxID=7574 RepID=A0A1S3H0I9_LINAN|nr:keratin-associated protein 5-5 [Lingula anatina]|eukprot:XP_013379640.1 keratin-associated protein 5-5 [Lingula anatina]
MVRQCLLSRGICGECNCCGKEGEPQCCECWIGFAECCNCCRSPNIESCLDSVCPQRRSMDFADIVTCQCCGEGGCCGENEQCCDCGNCGCNCNCNCDELNCLCCQISLKDAAPPLDDD